MHIASLELRNFRRFTDLTIADIPAETKLVLLIGANGSGKSSVFDGFEAVAEQNGKTHLINSLDFRKDKNTDSDIIIETQEFGREGIYDRSVHRSNKLQAQSFYGRTSFRQVPRLTRNQLGQGTPNILVDADRARSFIDREERFENDLEHLFARVLKEFFRTDSDKSEIKLQIVDPINQSLERIFGTQNGTKLQLLELIPPLEGNYAAINFRKGDSVFHYNLLSAGEKEVFNILVNLVARGSYFQDTIYYFDEIDLHLNTQLQYNLLKEITEQWIPGNCQLWTASHSLGFIEYAKQAANAVIIDFDNLNFDLPQTLTPVPKENPDVYDIAVGKEFLPVLFQNMTIVFVENKDKDYYASVGIEHTVFVSDNNRNNVYHKVRTTQYKGIVDRDFLSDDDIIIVRQQYKNLFILSYYSIENYFYHPDNLADYHQSNGDIFDKDIYIQQLTDAKNEAKDNIIPSLSLKRTEYPYFSEPEFNENTWQRRFKNKQENFDQSAIIAAYLNSNDLDQYYKVLPMKTYCKQLPQRQHLRMTDLAKTNWFRQRIKDLLQS